LVPGMYVSYYKGSQPIVSYHGSTDQYARSMQVMIDGRSVYMPARWNSRLGQLAGDVG
jgi:iron complex outermembrane receptor protein